MATTREKLIDWLADLPDSTEVGIEDEDLIVIIELKLPEKVMRLPGFRAKSLDWALPQF